MAKQYGIYYLTFEIQSGGTVCMSHAKTLGTMYTPEDWRKFWDEAQETALNYIDKDLRHAIEVTIEDRNSLND